MKKLTVAASGLVGIVLPLCLLPIGGFMILFGLAAPRGEPLLPLSQFLAPLIGIPILFVSGFVMFYAGYPQRFANVRYRFLALALLLVPLTIGVALATAPGHHPFLTSGAVILAIFTAWLQLLCMRPSLLATA